LCQASGRRVKPPDDMGAPRSFHGGVIHGVSPTRTKVLIIGAGIHGLSTAWHLGEALRKSGRGSGKDILVVDKSGNRLGRLPESPAA